MILIAMLSASLASPPAAAPLSQNSAQDASQPKPKEKKPKKHSLRWDPPDVDARVGSLASSPPCVLSQVLDQAGARMTEMIDNLQNFTASEKIEYQVFDDIGSLQDGGRDTFNYLVNFDATAKVSIQETRTPSNGTTASPASSQDKGLPEMALIFLPRLQRDYEMSCEGLGNWNGRSAWVIQFRQRADRPAETLLFSGRMNSMYEARLKGRAWIAADSGEVIHLDTSLMAAIPMMQVRSWALSIDYAPVQFHTQDVTIWLPQTVDAYCELEKNRSIVYHEFSNFQLFSVQTKQVIDKPKDPQ